MLDHNIDGDEKLEPDYNKWVVDGTCMPQAAASLILGLNPFACIIMGKRSWKDVIIRVKEVQQVSDVLCDGGRPWCLFKNLNIFDHVNTAIKNRIDIAEGLMAEINHYFANCIDKDKERFVKNQPYLARALEQPIDIGQKKEPKANVTEKERPQMLQIILGMAVHGYRYNPNAIKNTATGSKHGSIRTALQSIGLNVHEDTIRKYLSEASGMFVYSTPTRTPIPFLAEH